MRSATQTGLELVDTTLRDGEQAAGVVFAPDEKIALAAKLAGIGIHELEIGIAAADGIEKETIRSILRFGLPSRLTLWCRAKESDLLCAHALGTKAVHLSFPASDILLKAQRKDSGWLAEQIHRLIPSTREMFEFVSVGLQDASRTVPERVLQLCGRFDAYGVDRVRLADTVGVWEPLAAHEVFRQLKMRFPSLRLGFHAHNDLGMAVGNTIAAICAGIHSVDVTVNGLGERAGNAALEEVVMACRIGLRKDCGIDTESLTGLSQMVETMSGRANSPQKPVTGQNAFRHESGIHVHAMLRDCRSYEAFGPEVVGRPRESFVIGKHSGRAALRAVLKEANIEIDPSLEDRMIQGVRQKANEIKRALSRPEVESMYRGLVTEMKQ